MAKRKQKNIIDISEALNTFLSYDLTATEFNTYQIRIKIPIMEEVFFDWYHTTGSLVITKNGFNISLGKLLTAEEVALKILKELNLDN